MHFLPRPGPCRGFPTVSGHNDPGEMCRTVPHHQDNGRGARSASDWMGNGRDLSIADQVIGDGYLEVVRDADIVGSSGSS